MAKNPFNDDVMTMIMGISPDEPGQHGRTSVKMPTEDAITFIIKLRDMCEEFLQTVGKKDKSQENEDMEESEDESPFSKASKKAFGSKDKENEDE